MMHTCSQDQKDKAAEEHMKTQKRMPDRSPSPPAKRPPPVDEELVEELLLQRMEEHGGKGLWDRIDVPGIIDMAREDAMKIAGSDVHRQIAWNNFECKEYKLTTHWTGNDGPIDIR